MFWGLTGRKSLRLLRDMFGRRIVFEKPGKTFRLSQEYFILAANLRFTGVKLPANTNVADYS